VPGRSEALAQRASRVEQVLVDRVAVRAELERQDIDRNAVERDRDERVALAVGQVADRRRENCELLALLDLGG
jgi:hypothetical protein